MSLIADNGHMETASEVVAYLTVYLFLISFLLS
jgi:hypothetical protein